MKLADAVIMQHFRSERIEASAANVPPCRDNHCQITRLEFFSLLDKFMVNRHGAGAVSAIAELIGGIADDNVEFHWQHFLRIFEVDEFIGVCFELVTSLVLFL